MEGGSQWVGAILINLKGFVFFSLGNRHILRLMAKQNIEREELISIVETKHPKGIE